MREIKLFRKSTVDFLYLNVASNLPRYREGDFSDMLNDHSLFLESGLYVDDSQLSQLVWHEADDNEVNCCIAAFNGLLAMTPYLARDERLWSRLNHL